MGILENVLAKMQATPSFFPMSAETFSDWSIEAGDVVTVEVNGKDQTLPVFSADMDWGGAAMATLSCSGNRERPTLSKPERQSYAAFGGVSREIQKTNNKILEDRAELIAALNGEDGAPEDLSSGISNYVRYDLENNEAFAGSTLFAQIGEKAKAEIRVYTVLGSDGKAHSLADIVADMIRLQGRIDLSGQVSVSNGQLTVLGNLVARDSLQVGKDSFWIAGQKYTGKSITSTDGAEYTVLGA